MKVCECGRIGEHCPNAGCGSINKAPLKQRTTIVSRQMGQDIRYYTCRKCGVEYGYLGGMLYDGVCYAPKEVRVVAIPKNIEEEVELLNKAIEYIQSRDGVVDFPNGIKGLNEEEARVKTNSTLHQDPRGIPGIRDIQPGSMQERQSDLQPGISDTETPKENTDKLTLDDLFKRKDSTNDPESNI